MPKMMLLLAILSMLLLTEQAFATATFFAVPERTPDGFVSLRDEPGSQFKSVGEVQLLNLMGIGTEKCRSDFGHSPWRESP